MGICLRLTHRTAFRQQPLCLSAADGAHRSERWQASRARHTGRSVGVQHGLVLFTDQFIWFLGDAFAPKWFIFAGSLWGILFNPATTNPAITGMLAAAGGVADRKAHRARRWPGSGRVFDGRREQVRAVVSEGLQRWEEVQRVGVHMESARRSGPCGPVWIGAPGGGARSARTARRRHWQPVWPSSGPTSPGSPSSAAPCHPSPAPQQQQPAPSGSRANTCGVALSLERPPSVVRFYSAGVKE